MEKFKFKGANFDSDFSIEIFDISKESPVKFNNGMELYHNLNFKLNLDLDQMYKDFMNSPVETPNRNRNLGPIEYED